MCSLETVLGPQPVRGSEWSNRPSKCSDMDLQRECESEHNGGLEFGAESGNDEDKNRCTRSEVFFSKTDGSMAISTFKTTFEPVLEHKSHQ